jgi:preprotein translocase subunit SecE
MQTQCLTEVCPVDIKSISGKVQQFLREVRVELKKISWPLRKETIASTSVVLVLVMIISAFLGLVDMVLSRVVKIILS